MVQKYELFPQQSSAFLYNKLPTPIKKPPVPPGFDHKIIIQQNGTGSFFDLSNANECELEPTNSPTKYRRSRKHKK